MLTFLQTCLLLSFMMGLWSMEIHETPQEKYSPKYFHVNELLDYQETFPCQSFDTLRDDPSINQQCLTTNCGRRIIDGIFNQSDVTKLLEIAEKGMSYRTDYGGPTILDINTGYIRDSKGLENLFLKSKNSVEGEKEEGGGGGWGGDIYTSDDFSHYGRIIHKLKESVQQTFHLSSNLYFTAPTFITRINANGKWKPLGIHDEYWHPHVDMNNTKHYQYSGLLYLSSYQEDFTGGRIHFVNPLEYEKFETQFQDDLENILQENSNLIELTLEPKAGRVIIFSSGIENTHFVEQVKNGKRFVLSFWFTCEEKKQFQIFLDGQAHVAFSHKFRDQMLEAKAKTNRNYASKPKPKSQSNKEL